MAFTPRDVAQSLNAQRRDPRSSLRQALGAVPEGGLEIIDAALLAHVASLAPGYDLDFLDEVLVTAEAMGCDPGSWLDLPTESVEAAPAVSSVEKVEKPVSQNADHPLTRDFSRQRRGRGRPKREDVGLTHEEKVCLVHANLRKDVLAFRRPKNPAGMKDLAATVTSLGRTALALGSGGREAVGSYIGREEFVSHLTVPLKAAVDAWFTKLSPTLA